MQKLNLADDLSLPADEAITQKYGFIGRSGSGKSYAAMKLAELFLDHGGQIIALDWVGIWWSLRLAKGGKAPGFEHVYIFGGEHADVDLRPESGALMADLVVDKHISVILDVMHFRKAERTRFATAFAEQFFHRKKTARTACHLFIEEAQAYLPQMVRGEEARMVGVFEDIGKVGRNYGIGNSLISQRPQAINKDVLNQVEVLLAFQTNGPQERKAIAGWTAENTDAGAAMVQELPKLRVGDALVWSPQWLRVAKRVHIAPRTTYDASSTPTQQAKSIQPKRLAKADLEQLGEQITATIEKAKADDPRELRKQIAELKSQVAKAGNNISAPGHAEPKVIEKLVLKDGQLARAEGIVNAIQHEIARHEAAVTGRLDLLRELTQEIAGAIASTRATIPTPRYDREQGITDATAREIRRAGPATARSTRPASPVVVGDVKLNRLAERKILQVLAQFDSRSTKQLAIQSGYAMGGGGFRGAISKLRTLGLITGNGNSLEITAEGRAAIGDVDPLPTGPALVGYWMQQFNRLAEREVLRVLVDAYPTSLAPETIASRTEPPYEPNGGGFRGAVSKLRTLGLIEGRGELRATDDLFEGGH